MNIKGWVAIPVLSLTLGLASSIVPVSAETDGFGTTYSTERRVHCVTKKKLGVPYKSCASQHRKCSKFNGYNGAPATPKKCGEWRNDT